MWSGFEVSKLAVTVRDIDAWSGTKIDVQSCELQAAFEARLAAAMAVSERIRVGKRMVRLPKQSMCHPGDVGKTGVRAPERSSPP